MQVTVESPSTLERSMRVELPSSQIDAEVDSRLQQVGKTAKIKGFRPGKVPANVVRQRYGDQVRQEVLTDLMSKSFREAVLQEKLSPVDQPRIEPQVSDGDSFVYTASFEVLPEIELKGIDAIEVSKPDVKIDDAECDKMIDTLRRQKAEWNTVERKSKDGDRVIIDFDGSLDGENFAGGSGTEVPVVLGEGQMLPDFEKALLGVAAGDEPKCKVQFPEDYQAEELAGKKADFAIKIHRVEEAELPPMDDALAEAYGIQEGGLEKLRSDVNDNMHREAEQRSRADIRQQIMSGLLEQNKDLEVPKSLIQRESYSMQREAMQRMGVEDTADAPPIDNFTESAEQRVRLSLLISDLIEQESITVDQDRVRARVEQMCAGYDNAEDMVAVYMGNEQAMAQLQPMVLEDQAIDWILEHAKTSEKSVAFSDYMQPMG